MTTAELAEALRPVIREVVKEAMQSELREILTEAVEIASKPSAGSGDSFEIEDTPRQPLHFEKPDWVKQLDSRDQKQIREGKSPVTAEGADAQRNAIMNLLGQTAKGMTAEDKANFR